MHLTEFLLAEHRVSDEVRNSAAGIIRRYLKARGSRFQDGVNIPLSEDALVDEKLTKGFEQRKAGIAVNVLGCLFCVKIILDICGNQIKYLGHNGRNNWPTRSRFSMPEARYVCFKISLLHQISECCESLHITRRR